MTGAEPALLTLAEPIAEAQFRAMPDLAARYGPAGKRHCIDDNRFHLSFLAEASTLGDSSIFLHYVDWAKTMLSSRGVDARDLEANLITMRELIETSELENAADAANILDAAIRNFEDLGREPGSFLDDALPEARDYLSLLLEGRRRDASELVVRMADAGTALDQIYLQILEPVQQEVGRLWQLNQISVPQEHFCTAATQGVMAQLYPRFLQGVPGRRRMVSTCAGAELHEIGLRMVTDLLEMEGWDTIYLGANVPVRSIVEMLRDDPPALLAISATIAGNLGEAAALIEQVRAEPALENLPILVGGYPFRISRHLTELIGANATAKTAKDAVSVASEIAGD